MLFPALIQFYSSVFIENFQCIIVSRVCHLQLLCKKLTIEMSLYKITQNNHLIGVREK